MIKDLVNNWGKRKGLIRDALINQLERADKYNFSYKDLIKLVWRHVLDDHEVIEFKKKAIYSIDLDGSYSGDYVYIIRHWINIYVLRIEYGSCSACDSLEYALEHGIDDLMSLALHIVQETKEL